MKGFNHRLSCRIDLSKTITKKKMGVVVKKNDDDVIPKNSKTLKIKKSSEDGIFKTKIDLT